MDTISCPRCRSVLQVGVPRCVNCGADLGRTEEVSVPGGPGPGAIADARVVGTARGRRRSRVVIVAGLVALAVGIVAFVAPRLGPGLPERAAGFALVQAARLDALPNLRPPLGDLTARPLPESVEHRNGIYVRGDIAAEARTQVMDIFPVSVDDLVRGYGLDDQGDEPVLDAFTREGAQFVCAETSGSAACAWATDDYTTIVIHMNAIDMPSLAIDPRTGEVTDEADPPDPQIGPIKELALALHEWLA